MTITPGSGGSLTLDNRSAAATVTVTAGSHAIDAPIALNSLANISLSPGCSLGIGGAIANGTSANGVTVGGHTYTLALNNSAGVESLSSAAGANAGGGTAVVGGVQATCPGITTPGVFTSTYQTPTGLAAALGNEAAGQTNFVVAGSTAQLWELGFTGSFTGDYTVTFHFDPSLLVGVPRNRSRVGDRRSGVSPLCASEWAPVTPKNAARRRVYGGVNGYAFPYHRYMSNTTTTARG